MLYFTYKFFGGILYMRSYSAVSLTFLCLRPSFRSADCQFLLFACQFVDLKQVCSL